MEYGIGDDDIKMKIKEYVAKGVEKRRDAFEFHEMLAIHIPIAYTHLS